MLDEGPAAGAGGAAAGPRPAAHLTRIVGWMVSYDFNETGQAYDLRAGKTTIGRARDCGISLFYDGKASDHHATLIWRDGKCAVKDEASTNGTKVNGEDIGIGAVHALGTGDNLTVGSSTFLVFLVDSAQATVLWPKLKG
jgi:predicted component of type VI protein secretion system